MAEVADASPPGRASGRLITRVVLRNYKSIAACDVPLPQVTFLVGPNGSGKSNFLDALRFVADSLRSSLDHAVRDRGGINEVRRRSGGHPNHFAIRLDFDLGHSRGYYALSIAARKEGGHEVQREECQIAGRHSGAYVVESGRVTKNTHEASSPAASSDRLYLVNVSGIGAFRPVYDALAAMGFYSLDPRAIRDLQPPDAGDLLNRDGSNIASVLARLEMQSPASKTCIEDYLGRVVSGVSRVSHRAVGPRETLEFRQEVVGARHPWRFYASNMSDGTLRALGVLVALFQSAADGAPGRRLVGIEEPEMALHPGALGVLVDGLHEAGERDQVLVTSHSPDLLDNDEIGPEAVVAVVADEGGTRIGPLDEAGASIMRDHLYTAGELLRLDQLQPDHELTSLKPNQLRLFG